MTAAVVAVCAGAGLVVGLGVEVVVERLPQREPLNGWSRRDLNAGRAAMLAALTVALFVGLAVRYHDSWVLPAYLVLAAGLVALSVIDLEHFLLPNRIVYPLAIGTLALLAIAAVGDDAWAAFGRAILGGVASAVALGALHLVSPRSMGFGDVKLAFVLGLVLGWLGWSDLVLGLFCGFLAGAVVGLALIVLRHRGRKDHLPFGPFLAFGTLVVLLWGDAILRWYRG
ncbi:MAG TPA: A24 family peptidase [Acidimicrobiia bacterium]|nr:A24 family peptidase [Acidimicrobiia bacterium]